MPSLCFQCPVDRHDHIPDRAALEGLGRLRKECPDFGELLVPHSESEKQVINDPVAAIQLSVHLLWWEGKTLCF